MTITTTIKIGLPASTQADKTEKLAELAKAITHETGVHCSDCGATSELICDVEDLEPIREYLLSHDINFR